MLSELLENIYYNSPLKIFISIVIFTFIYLIGYSWINKSMQNKKMLAICFDVEIFIYILLILIITLFARDEQVGLSISLMPFSDLSRDKIRGNYMNILLFYPLGIFSGSRWNRKRIILIGTFLSLIIEMSQYFGNLGYAEADDVINNTIGMALGVSVMLVFEKVCLHYDKNRYKDE